MLGSFCTSLLNVHNKLNEYDTDVHNTHRIKNLNLYMSMIQIYIVHTEPKI